MATARRLLSVVVSLALVPMPAGAQILASTFLDPSIEASGTGGGSAAVFWRDEPNEWANPALLGTQQGLRYSYGTTTLPNDLGEDASFKSHRLLLGAAGLGLSLAGKPFDSIGEMKLDYGTSVATDVDGNVVGTYHAFEEVRSLALGVSVVDLLSSAFRVLGKDPIALRRRLTIALGHTWKDVVRDFAPGSLPVGGGARGEADEKDRGALVRMAILDPESSPAITQGTKRSPGNRFKVEVAAGYAQLNYGDGRIPSVWGGSDAVFEQRRYGASGRATMARAVRDGWIWNFASPTIALGLAWETTDVYDDGEKLGDYEWVVGQELSLGDVLFLRHGSVHDSFFSDRTMDAWGVGAALQYRKGFGVRFDWAKYPERGPVGDLDRWGITAFFDPIALMLDKPTFGEKFKM